MGHARNSGRSAVPLDAPTGAAEMAYPLILFLAVCVLALGAVLARANEERE